VDRYKLLQECIGFEWDQHNIEKNWEKHNVTPLECEQIFFNQPMVIADDSKHSQTEQRFYSLGKTDLGRKLFVVYTIRKKKIRIISARDMNKKEIRSYERNA
jgi:uncharacterized protein